MKKVENWSEVKALIDEHTQKYQNRPLQWFFDCTKLCKYDYYRLRPEGYLFPGQKIRPPGSGAKRKKKRASSKTSTKDFIEVLEQPELKLEQKEQEKQEHSPEDAESIDALKIKKVSSLLEIAKMINES